MLNNVSNSVQSSAFDIVDIGLIVLDQNNIIVDWNEWMAATSRLPAADVVGRSLFDVFPAIQKTRLPIVIADSFEVGSSSILTHTLNRLLPLQTMTGEPVLHNVVIRPISSQGQSYCLLQITDVTVPVTRERVLRERQNARYHAIVDSAPDAIITIDLERKIQWVNGAAERIFGYSSDELLGQDLNVILGPASKFALGQPGARAIEHETEVLGYSKGGNTGYFDVSLSRWHADQRDFATTTWRDVTDRMANDRALRDARETLQRANEELESRVEARTNEREIALRQLHESQKMESIGQLTGGVAHDFNNLLAVILGSLSLIKKAVPDDPRISRFLDRAMQGAERGATLTNRLLAFARRQELKVEVVRLHNLVPEMLDFLRHSVGPNVTIHIEISPEVSDIEVDANQLELGLINLAVNARDAMPQGGSLTISCHNETGGRKLGLPHDRYVCIKVADTGEGMSEATLARAQEPFFTTKGIGKGTGLGLSMVHGFIAQSGGMMKIRSSQGKGTTITLWLPIAQERSIPKITEEIAAAPTTISQSQRVLLVDDDILVSMGVADMLHDLGHSVTEAASASQALKLLESGLEFDVVVTDYAMPDMNGFDLAVRIKQLDPRMPIILATGYAELPAHKGIEFGRLTKPYSENELAAAIKQSTAAQS
jgi:PAS domain S-box-containing protein